MKEVMKRDALVYKMKCVARVIIYILLIIIPFLVLAMIDKVEKDRAIEICGGRENLITKVTELGDNYYECKND